MNRIVLLGASNLTLAFPHVAGLAAAGFGPGPVSVLAAAGHGRGYALPSRVLGRGLPAIAACGLWRELERNPGARSRALIADVGNDLAFGAGVDTISDALDGCLERLRAAGSEIILVLPPAAGIERLSPVRFAALRALLFPGRSFEQRGLIRQLHRLTAALRQLAAGTRAEIVEIDPGWLGGDGIHIRWRRRRTAWGSLLAGWRPAAGTAAPPAPLRWSWRRAERASLIAVARRHAQPCRRLADGTTLGCY